MKNRFSNIDKKIIIFFSLTFVTSICALYFELFAKQSTDDIQPEIAKIEKTSNDIRIKKSDQFDWITSNNNESVRSGDQIFSGDKSSVSILLAEGKTLEVQENSLVKFDQIKNVKNFKVSYGSIKTSIKKDEIFQITVCGKVMRIKADADEQLSVSNEDNCKAPRISIGKKLIPVKSTQTQRRVAQVAIDIIEKSKPVPLPALIQLPTPKLVEAQVKLPAEKKSELIYWEKVEHADYYVVSVTDASESKEVLYKTQTENNFFEFKNNFGSKKYQFLIEAHTNQKEFINSSAATGAIELVFKPIVLIDSDKTKVMKTKTSQQIADPENFNISWQKIPQTKYYKIDFYKDDKLKNSLSSNKVFTNNINLVIKNFDTQYYKVSAYNRHDEFLSESKTYGKISYEKEFLLNKPNIEESNKNLSYFFQSTEGQFIRLSWQNLQKDLAPHHYIEIASTDDFSTIIKTYKTDSMSLQIDETMPSGKYFWRVKSYGDEIISDWSDTALLKIKSARSISSVSAQENKTSKKDNKNQQNK